FGRTVPFVQIQGRIVQFLCCQNSSHTKQKTDAWESVGLIFSLELSLKTVESDILVRDTKILAHLLHRTVHQRRSAEIKLDIFGGFVMVEIVLDHTVVDKSNKTVPLFIIDVLLYLPVVLFQGFRKGDIEFEVREFPLQGLEVLDIEQLPLGTSPIPIGHLSVGLQGLEQVVEVGTHGRHSGTTAHIEHFSFGFVDEELPKRS